MTRTTRRSLALILAVVTAGHGAVPAFAQYSGARGNVAAPTVGAIGITGLPNNVGSAASGLDLNLDAGALDFGAGVKVEGLNLSQEASTFQRFEVQGARIMGLESQVREAGAAQPRRNEREAAPTLIDSVGRAQQTFSKAAETGEAGAVEAGRSVFDAMGRAQTAVDPNADYAYRPLAASRESSASRPARTGFTAKAAAILPILAAPSTALAAEPAAKASAAGYAAAPLALKIAPVFAPLAYAFHQWRRDRKAQGVVTRGDDKTAITATGFGEGVEAGIHYLFPIIGSAIATGIADGGVMYAAVMAGLWIAGSAAVRDSLARSRREIEYFVQHSHDLRMRIDPSNGQLRDIRGGNKAYGDGPGFDKYTKYKNGKLLAGERFAVDAISMIAGAAWTAWAGWAQVAIFAAVYFAYLLMQDAFRKK